MEATVLSLAKSVLSGVVSEAKSAIKEEVALQLGVNKDLVFINDEFEMMQTFLMAADEEEGEKKVVRTWVKQVRDLGYDVEDSLQDFALHLEKKTSWWRFPCTLKKRHAIAKDIKDLKARVDDVSHRNMRYRSIEDPSSRPTTAADKYMSSSSSVFGIGHAAKQDNEKVDLAGLITRGSKELMVISVWGTSSDVGKMSTIRKVYDDPKVTEKFACRAWVKLMDPFNPVEFIRSLVRQFYGNSNKSLIGNPEDGRTKGVHISRSMALEEEELEDEFDKLVSNNQYMIVIEDLSTISEWDWLKLYLPDNKKGSRIIVSTQHIELAGLCVGQTNQVSELKQFSPDQSLYIIFPEDTDREKVLKLISQDSMKREIISVWGTDGSEKTDLLESIYNELDSEKFTKSAWITVSPHFADQVLLIKDLVLKLNKEDTDGNLEEMRAAELTQELVRLLREQKYLIVLHGITSSTEWDSLVNILPEDEKCSSRIIVTTTNQSIADYCSGKRQNTYRLEGKDGVAVDPNEDTDREKVFKLISQDSMKREIISVWGTDSSEKTDLLESIYNELDNEKFPKSAWITVSPHFADQVLLLKGLVLKLKKEDADGNLEAMGAAELTQELVRLLRGQKYLIVLYGITSSTEWDSLVNILPEDEECSSRIIVTTTIQSIAEYCSGKRQNTYRLEGKDGVAVDPNEEKPVVFNGITSEPVPVGPQLTGRNKEITCIKDKLISGDKPQVISLWGMGGVGKTAVVESMYRSREIIKEFPVRVWANFPQPFNPEEFQRSVAMQIQECTEKKQPVDILVDTVLHGGSQRYSTKKIKELLGSVNGKKRLIVVDGLPSESAWRMVVASLRETLGEGSRVIVTTREASVANHCSVTPADVFVLELKGLKCSDAFELFKTLVSKTAKNFESDPEMKEISDNIIRKCDGLPAAITTIAGFLASRSPPTTMEWRKISDNIGAELELNSSLESINKMVISSYKGLPFRLKSCFLYLSIFVEGQNLRRRRLVRRWVAEGYSREMLTKTAEEIGEDDFTDLISRSMIQPLKTTARNYVKIGSCRLNTLMHEISISKSKEEKLVCVLDNSGFSSRSRHKVRHVVVSSRWSREKKFALKRILDVSRMRSLTVFGDWGGFLISSKMRLLRVLDLEDTTGLRDNHLAPIGKLCHLKYLSLRGSRGIFNLPKSFGKLRNLETLDIRGTLVTLLPASIVKLQKLSYLRAGYIPYTEVDSSSKIMDVIRALVKLISLICKIRLSMGSIDEQENRVSSNFGPIFGFISSILFKGLDPYGVKVPKGAGNLKNLHTLGVVNVANRKTAIQEINKLTELRKLGVTGINKKNGKDFCSALSDLSHLESLSVRAEGKTGLDDYLDGLSSAPRNLQSLKLYGKLASLPKWINEDAVPRNLAKLNLRSTRLSYDVAMKALGVLPNLVILRLWRNAFEGKDLEVEFSQDTFPRLNRLEIANLDNLKFIKFRANTVVELEVIQVNYCQIFDEGGFSGIDFLGSLKEVVLKGEYEEEFKAALQAKVTNATLIMSDN